MTTAAHCPKPVKLSFKVGGKSQPIATYAQYPGNSLSDDFYNCKPTFSTFYFNNLYFFTTFVKI